MERDRTALVLGATGGIGSAVAAALMAHGWRVTGLARTPPPGRAGPLSWVTGDASNPEDVARAAEGTAVLVHAVNPPGYRGWGRVVLPMLDNTIAAARAVGARILLPGTIYNFGPDAFPLLREDAPQNPTTRKGAIRAEMERRLRAAAQDGMPALVVRAGDFFGSGARNNWFGQGLVRPGRPVRSVTVPNAPGVGHAWAYLPDVAETMARLLDAPDRLAPFETVHVAGQWDPDGTAMVAAIRRVVGEPRLAVRRFPWWILPLAAPFNETMRELREMRGFWRTPVRLDNARLLALLGSEPHTRLDEAVRATLEGLGCLGPGPDQPPR